MNHQPFRDWLFSDEELSSEQIQLLDNHLQSCVSCVEIRSSWNEVEKEFHKAPRVVPAPGFTNRWQTHLAKYEYRKQKQRGWATIGFTAVIATLLLAILISQFWTLSQTPGPYLVAWFTNMLSILSIYFTFHNIISPLSLNTPLNSAIGVFLLFGVISFMSVLWLAAYRRLSVARRMI